MPRSIRQRARIVYLENWVTGPDGEIRAAGRRLSAESLALLGASAAVRLEPFDRTKPSAWCFGYRRARDGMLSFNPPFRRGPMPGDLDEPCFRLGYEKGGRDAKRGKLYEPDYGVSHASSYAEVGIRVAGTGPAQISLNRLLDLILRED